MTKNLYVGNLATEATEQELRDLFSQAGEISELKIISDMNTGESRGFGFVEMATDEGAQEAVTRFNGYNLASRDIVVNVARPRADRSAGGPRQ
jgi:RNA recognition motif-containing protein